MIKTFFGQYVKDKHLRRFIVGAGGSFLVRVGGGAASFGLHILLARSMGVDSYGIYVFVFAWLQVAYLLGTLGLDSALLRFASFYEARGSWGQLKGVAVKATQWIISSSLVLCLLVSFYLFVFADKVDSQVVLTLAIGLVSIPFINVGVLQQALLRVYERPVRSMIPEQLIRPAFMALCVILLYYVRKKPLPAPLVMTFSSFAALLTFGILFYSRLRYEPVEIKNALGVLEEKKEWLYTALPMLFISSMYMLNSRVDILMLGSLRDTTEAGVYNVASRVATLLVFGLQAVNMLVAPDIAKGYAKNEFTQMQQNIRFAVVGSSGVTIPVAILLLYFGDDLLGVFGAQFIVAATALKYLTIAQMINALCGPVGYLMIMTGHQVQAAKIVAVTVLVNIALNLWLIPKMGVSGAGLATSLTIVMWNYIMVCWVVKKLHVNPTIFCILPFFTKPL